ncbi:hypothetical protein B0H13DRAFT_2308369 [Mycena leptocephala]|nr:hypothetical protein B0H13DRAFT_2308369 [Mycena leptocephala]
MTFPDAALSILASDSDLPDNSTAKVMAAILLIAVVAAALLYYLSPMRLARDRLALGVGRPHSGDVIYTRAQSLAIREGTLRNSLSLGSTLREFCAGRTFSLRCIREVHELATHIEVHYPPFDTMRSGR